MSQAAIAPFVFGVDMVAPIIGICRFSFLGRGDWSVYARTRHGSAEEAEARHRSRALLYDEARLRFRFLSFERLTLASLRAQSLPDFRFIVLSSPEMPQPWRDRLQSLCATLPQARLVFSAAPDVGSALAPLLAEMTPAGRRPVQFRLDDDDCLCSDYVARLADAADGLRNDAAFAFSLPRAVVVTHYPEAGAQYYELTRPFHAAGAAARLSRPGRSIFAFGHYALMHRFPALIDAGPVGSLQLKFQGHDSRKVTAADDRRLTAVTRADFGEILARHFPFLALSDLADLMALHGGAQRSVGE